MMAVVSLSGGRINRRGKAAGTKMSQKAVVRMSSSTTAPLHREAGTRMTTTTKRKRRKKKTRRKRKSELES